MTLETLIPPEDWDAAANEAAIEVLGNLDESFQLLIWCDDGCSDCQALLPQFGAALDAAGVPDERVIQYAVERLPEGKKRGPRVDAYGINRIPTVVVERDGEEVARFVEGEGGPIAASLAGQLREADATG